MEMTSGLGLGLPQDRLLKILSTQRLMQQDLCGAETHVDHLGSLWIFR